MKTAVFREYLTGKHFSRDTRKTFYSADCTIWYTLSEPTLYIPSLPTKCKRELLREYPSKNTWELETVIPTILYTFVCGISSSPTFTFPYHWEVDSTNTYHTLWECQVRFLVLLGSIGRRQGWQMQHGACCRIRSARQDMFREALLE